MEPKKAAPVVIRELLDGMWIASRGGERIAEFHHRQDAELFAASHELRDTCADLWHAMECSHLDRMKDPVRQAYWHKRLTQAVGMANNPEYFASKR